MVIAPGVDGAGGEGSPFRLIRSVDALNRMLAVGICPQGFCEESGKFPIPTQSRGEPAI
jgi:hypothetical protein